MLAGHQEKGKIVQKKKEQMRDGGEIALRNFRENKKLFWKQVDSMKRTRDQTEATVRRVDVKERSEYFEVLFNTLASLEGVHPSSER